MTSPSLPPQVQAALSRGNKIEAIKLLRQATGLGLAEAKHAIDNIRTGGRGAASRARPPAPPPPAPAATPAEATLAAVQEALRNGQKLEAIRLYRQFAGVGLKQAKEAVDTMEQTPAAPTMESFMAGGLAPGEVPRSRDWWSWVLAIAFGAALFWLVGT